MSSKSTTVAFRYARNPQWAKVRAEVMKRDDYLCRYCTDWADCVDHVLPHSFGGRDDLDNLVAACDFCNRKAGSKVFDSFETKKEYLLQFLPEKIKHRRRKICICPDCGEFFEYRKNGATAVLCGLCMVRDSGEGYRTMGAREIDSLNKHMAEDTPEYAL
jgi:ribosomal protein L37AE/L43A